ncbi:hypothetical protein BJ508DRAFT_411662 [Ascobolus immersus RN42]|uniref:DUF7580 domain-containing protein n=1 Tax=Ascobolus immersus RN42 TaxID=1160509 RepID=A0A3N4ILR5_ASCIM|nr:hypothetical protein BJ508DRAFT_411662 [Ascobolus immersus RN42]
MSGFEVAGLILGGIPLLLEALDRYKELYRGTKSWLRFRSSFRKYHQEVTIQLTSFSENLEELLESIVCSDYELQLLLDNPGGSPWEDPRIEDKLRQLLPRSYESYMSLIADVNEIIAKIEDDLEMVDGKIAWNEEPLKAVRSKLEKKLVRAFRNSSRLERVQELEKKNTQLGGILKAALRLSGPRKARKTVSGPKFLQIARESALSIHSLFTQCWECKVVTHRHSAKLFLENYGSSSPSSNRASTAPLLLSMCFVDENDEFGLTAKITEISKDCSGLPESCRDAVTEKKVAETKETVLIRPTVTTTSTVSVLSRRPKKSVKFLSESVVPSVQAARSKVIRALCESIRFRDITVDCCGYLVRPNVGYASLSAVEEQTVPQIAPGKQVTLLAILAAENSDARCSMTKLQRLELAVKISAALMYFHGTPWIEGCLKNYDIAFPVSDSEATSVVFEKPYVSHCFPPPAAITRSTNKRTEEQVRQSLRSLAFILLELCFGRSLLSKDEPFEEQTIGNQFDLILKWQDKAGEELGKKYAEAVKRCIYPDSDFVSSCSRAESAGDEVFQQGVYSWVFRPLEDTLNFWASN